MSGCTPDTIAIWPATARGQNVTHFWYEANSGFRRACDNEGWPVGDALVTSPASVYAGCDACRDLYVEDIVKCDGRLRVVSHVEMEVPPFSALGGIHAGPHGPSTRQYSTVPA